MSKDDVRRDPAPAAPPKSMAWRLRGIMSRRILSLPTDRSRWVQLSGTSGHAFHPNYADQVEPRRTGQTTPMRWDPRRE